MQWKTTPLLAVLASAAVGLAASGTARAGDEFEDGFKDELGRIAAHEAFGIGRNVLAHLLEGGHSYGYYPGYGYTDYPIYGRYYDRDDDDWDHRRRHHWRHGYDRYDRPYWRYWGHGPRWGGWGHHHRHHRHHHRHHHHHHHGCRH